MSTLRQQIFAAVRARFQTILVANGYATSIGQTVLEWQLTSVEAAQLPLIMISDAVETAQVEEKNAGTYSRSLEITANVALAEADSSAATARAALGDVIKAIGTDQKWSGMARRTLPVSDEIVVDDQGARIGGVRIKFSIEYGRQPWVA